MSAEKDKKGKGKKKAKGKDKKSGLSNQEREIYLLTMAELEHKIEWRNHMSAIIEEDMKLFEERLQLRQKDKKEAVKLLEESIEEERGLTEKIEGALPDAESAKNEGEESRARELASKLLQIKQEKLSNDAELEVMRKKVKSLEAYRPNNVDKKIKEIQKQLEADDVEDIFLKAEEEDIQRKEYFRKEMQDILQKEANSFQAEISGKLDKNFERITEETRWWADTVNGLRIATERLEGINDTNSANLRAAQKNLKRRKAASIRESQKLQERETLIKTIRSSNKQLEAEKSEFFERQERLNFLYSIAKNLKENLDNQDNNLTTCLNKMKRNEIEIKNLEEKLSREILFGNQLQEYIEGAQHLIMEEVKQSLILTYNGPPEQKNTVEQMRSLFEEATRFIYERKNKSAI